MNYYNNNHLNNTINSKSNILLSYITAGYPNKKDSVNIIYKLYKSGIDIIELGIPSPKPINNSKTIHNTNIIALRNNINIDDCFDIVYHARLLGVNIPILFMSYFNIYQQYGLNNLISRAKIYGLNGFIVIDQPQNNTSIFYSRCNMTNTSYIPLITNTITDKRLIELDKYVNSFIYLLDINHPISNNINQLITKIKTIISKPIVVGMNTYNKSFIHKIWKFANGIVLGVAIITIIKYNFNNLDLFIQKLKSNIPTHSIDFDISNNNNNNNHNIYSRFIPFINLKQYNIRP